MSADYTGWGLRLQEHFGDLKSDDDRASWEAMKDKLSIGDRVSGTVITKAHFGAWIDVGVGFPALLEIIRMDGMTPEKYQSDDWCPAGSQVDARISGFSDDGFQIGLTQEMPPQE